VAESVEELVEAVAVVVVGNIVVVVVVAVVGSMVVAVKVVERCHIGEEQKMVHLRLGPQRAIHEEENAYQTKKMKFWELHYPLGTAL